MYNKNLSDLFDKSGYDNKKYPWNFKHDSIKEPTSKIFYAIGDSWLFSNFFNRLFFNNYKNYMLINRSISGMSNSLIVNTLKNDIKLLTAQNNEIVFLVSFSEVGRTTNDLGWVNPEGYKSTHDFFAEILKKQYSEVHELIKNYPHFITTGFITNNFNKNKSILDFCGNADREKPKDVFTVTSNGILEFLKDRNDIFKFDFTLDVNKSLDLLDYINKLEHIDDTLHPNWYKPYEQFMEEVFSNLHKH